MGGTGIWSGASGTAPGRSSRRHAILAPTERITAATGILNLWMHEPKEAGQEYARLVAAHGDRLLMGIGISHAPLVELLHPGAYTKPVARMREYLDNLDAADPSIPVDRRVLAALGPKMLELAA